MFSYKNSVKAATYITFCPQHVWGSFLRKILDELKLHQDRDRVEVRGGRNFLSIKLYWKYSEYCLDKTNESYHTVIPMTENKWLELEGIYVCMNEWMHTFMKIER